jgi:hypothetical protein
MRHRLRWRPQSPRPQRQWLQAISCSMRSPHDRLKPFGPSNRSRHHASGRGMLLLEPSKRLGVTDGPFPVFRQVSVGSAVCPRLVGEHGIRRSVREGAPEGCGPYDEGDVGGETPLLVGRLRVCPRMSGRQGRADAAEICDQRRPISSRITRITTITPTIPLGP